MLSDRIHSSWPSLWRQWLELQQDELLRRWFLLARVGRPPQWTRIQCRWAEVLRQGTRLVPEEHYRRKRAAKQRSQQPKYWSSNPSASVLTPETCHPFSRKFQAFYPKEDFQLTSSMCMVFADARSFPEPTSDVFARVPESCIGSC